MSFWVPAAISAASSIYGAITQGQQNYRQAQWNNYNANMQYGADMVNSMMGQVSARINANLAMQAGVVNAKNALNQAQFNAEQIYMTSLYNDDLMEEELAVMWDRAELDLTQLANQRAREAGAVMVGQAASGTVIDEGSNLDTMVDLKTQEAMDAFIIRHGADVNAANINNARRKSLYEGEMAIIKTKYEGRVAAWQSMADASAQAQGTMMNANLQGIADRFSAASRRQSGIAQARMNFGQNRTQINNSLVSGLFSAASSGVSSYYKAKVPNVPTSFSSSTQFGPMRSGYVPAVAPKASGGTNWWQQGGSLMR